jgi:protocatechuate 3,4-dioxygenase beta subunit
MRRKSEPQTISPRSKSVNRRQVLEGLGALAATAACSSSESSPPTHGDAGEGAGATAGTASGVGGASNAAGQASSVAGAGGGSIAGAPNGSDGSGGSGTTVHDGTGGATSGGGAGAQNAAGQSSQAAGAPGAGGPSAASAGTTGNSAGTGTGGAPSAAGAVNGGAAGVGDAVSLVSPPWDDVPTCTASNTDAAGQGPFFIHDLEKADDISLVRQDIRGRYNQDAEPGLEMHLHLRVLSSQSSSCNQTPVVGADVYIWHTDGQGFYSGFGTRGGSDEQKPDSPYSGTPSTNQLENTDRFLRGVQTTDANGVVSFRSIFPGWYNGRALHIHFVAFKAGSISAGRVAYTAQNSDGKWLFTTQFYFDPAFAHSIHEKNQPYLRRTTLSAYNDALAANESGNSNLHAKASLAGDSDGAGGIVTAQLQILLDPKA